MKQLAPILLLASLSSHAGGYVGMAMGVSHVDSLCQDSMTDCDEEPFALQMVLGYRPVPFLAVEAGYNIYGEQSYVDTTEHTLTAELEGFSVSVLGIIPLGIIDVYGKIGAVRWEEEHDYSGRTVYEDYGYAPLVGAGIGVNFTENFSLRANVEGFNINDDVVTTGSIGFTVGF